MAASIPVTVTTSRQDVYTDKAAAPFQHVFSQAILSGKKIYCSGSIGLSTETDVLVEGGIQAETVCRPPLVVLDKVTTYDGLLGG